MYCYIEYTDMRKGDPDDNQSEQSNRSLQTVESVHSAAFEIKKMLVNPNCPIQILLNYISEEIGFGRTVSNYDLCNIETGKLLDINSLQPWQYATEIIQPLKTYIVVFYEKNKQGEYKRLEPLINKHSRQYSEVLLKIKKQLGSTTLRRSSLTKKRKSSTNSKDSTKNSIAELPNKVFPNKKVN